MKDNIYDAKELNVKVDSILLASRSLSCKVKTAETAINNIAIEDSFQGEYADSLKAYFKEVHIKMIQSLDALVQGTYAISNKVLIEATICLDSQKDAIIDTSGINKKLLKNFYDYENNMYYTNEDICKAISEHKEIVDKHLGYVNNFNVIPISNVIDESMNCCNQLNSVITSLKRFDEAKLIKPLTNLIDDMNKLMEYCESIQQVGIKTYKHGDINNQPWINDLNTNLEVFRMINRSAIYTNDEIKDMSNDQLEKVIMDLYGIDKETLVYFSGVYGLDYSDPEACALVLRGIFDILRGIDRNGNPVEMAFFNALATKDYDTAFSIPLNKLSIFTLEFLNQTILSFQTRDIGEFQDFLQAMLISKDNYKSSVQSMYLTYTYQIMAEKLGSNADFARNNDISADLKGYLLEQEEWLLNASGLVQSLYVVNVVQGPTNKIKQDGLIHTYTEFTGMKLSNLHMHNNHYVCDYHYMTREIVRTFTKIDNEMINNGDQYEMSDIKYGEYYQLHPVPAQIYFFINSSSAELSAKYYKEMEERKQEIKRALEDNVISAINLGSYLGSPAFAVFTHLTTESYKVATRTELDDVVSAADLVKGLFDDKNEISKRIPMLDDFTNVYKASANYSRLDKREQEIINEFMTQFATFNHVELAKYTHPITENEVAATTVVKLNADIVTNANLGIMERHGLIGLYGNEVKDTLKAVKKTLEKNEDTDKEQMMLEKMQSKEGFSFDGLDIDVFVKLLPYLDEELHLAGYPTLAEKITGRMNK